MKTAVVKDAGGYRVIKNGTYFTRLEFGDDLRMQGYKVIKIWDTDKTVEYIMDWLRKKGCYEG